MQGQTSFHLPGNHIPNKQEDDKKISYEQNQLECLWKLSQRVPPYIRTQADAQHRLSHFDPNDALLLDEFIDAYPGLTKKDNWTLYSLWVLFGGICHDVQRITKI